MVSLLSKLSEAKHHIEVKMDMDELDLTSAEAKATSDDINGFFSVIVESMVAEEEERRAKKYYKYMSYAKCTSQRELREAYVEIMIELEEIRLKEKYGK